MSHLNCQKLNTLLFAAFFCTCNMPSFRMGTRVCLPAFTCTRVFIIPWWDTVTTRINRSELIHLPSHVVWLCSVNSEQLGRWVWLMTNVWTEGRLLGEPRKTLHMENKSLWEKAYLLCSVKRGLPRKLPVGFRDGWMAGARRAGWVGR